MGKANTSSKLYIKNEMAQLDLKNQSFYDELSPDEKKKFSTFLMLKWGANVYGSEDLQTYYLLSFNEHINKNFFDINKHTKLQWLSLTAATPGVGTQSHYWLTTKKKETNNKLKKFLLEMFPNFKDSDIDVLIQVTTKKEIEEWLLKHGLSDKEIQNVLN